MILVHGRSFTQGTSTDDDELDIAEWMATGGFGVFSIVCRLPPEANDPAVKMPQLSPVDSQLRAGEELSGFEQMLSNC